MSVSDLVLQTFLQSVGEKLALETQYTPTLDVCNFNEMAPQEKNKNRMFPIVIVQFNNNQ